MLEILLGTDLEAIGDAVLSRVSRAAAAGVVGQILIVPEQYSHEAERALCRAGGDGISLAAEVLSFSRLAARVAALYGGVSRRSLDQGGRLVAMAQAMEQVGSRLKLYGAGRRKPELLLRLLAALDEFRGACIDAAQLRHAAAEAGGQLAVKLEELALIQESFETVCDALGQDAQDRLLRLQEQLEVYPYAAGRRIYLYGFSDFTGRELEVIGALLGEAETVVVGLLGDGTDQGVFALGAETGRHLRAQTARCGCPLRVRRLPPALRPDELEHLRRNLFASAPSPWPSVPACLTLHHAGSVYAACLEAAGQIQRLAMEGWRYRDIAVCCTDAAVYRPVLESVLARASIPAYVSGADAADRDPLVGTVLSALDAATGGLEPEDVLRFLKSGLSPLDSEDCDRLENYVRTWRIRGRRWESEWDMHPDGYGFPLDEAAQSALSRLNDARIRGVGPLIALRDGLQAAGDTAGQAEALYAFLEHIGLAGTLERLQAKCQSEAELRQAQACGQIYELMIQALEQLHQVLGRTVREPEDFARMFAAVLSQYTVGTIPANLDSVAVGDPAAMRFGRRRFLLVLGADDGLFPAYPADSSVLSEQERRQLLSLGLAVSPGQSLGLDRTMTVLYQVLTSPSERLFVSYSTDRPSHLFTRMQALFPAAPLGADAAIPEIFLYDAAAVGELAASGAALAPLAQASGAVREAAAEIGARVRYRPGALERGGVEALYGKKLRLSASRADQFAACRCAYFLRYGLGLRTQKEAAFDAPVYGTFVHAILEETTRQVRQEGGFHQVSEERLLEIARARIDAYGDETLRRMLARSERMAYLYRRNQEEVLEVVRELGRELRQSDFEPAGFEVEFSAAGAMPAVEIQGATAAAQLTGFVDRVDLYTRQGVTYVRVVDYKTGKKAFDYTDILSGMGLQMLIYLFALESGGDRVFGGRLQPAGVLYFPARRPVLTAAGKLPPEEAGKKRQSELVRKGLISENDVVLHAMEHFERQPVYMPYKLSAKGEKVGDLMDSGEMALLRAHVERTLARMADDLAAGGVDPDPVRRGPEDTACTYCDFAQVCHRASGEVADRPLRKIDRAGFWRALEEDAEHG
ncbi:MAG: hypothetical protein HFF17_00290 [Oscillospiraceae bacterium]|nr:hypothetical protein [Oscillospiraceae bacterium]